MGDAAIVQSWECFIISVDWAQRTFWARLVPVIGEGGDQEAEVHMHAVPEAERARIMPGACFTWSITGEGSRFSFR